MSNLKRILESATALQSSTGTIAKKVKTEQITYPLLNVLYRKLYDIKSWGTSQGKSPAQLELFVKEVEVEVRIGMIVCGPRRWKTKGAGRDVTVVDETFRTANGLAFKSGVDPTFETKLKKKLASSNLYNTTKQPLQILRSDNNKNRWEVDDNGNLKTFSEEKKERFVRSDIALLSFDYDARLDGATEKKVPSENTTNITSTNTWTQERRKDRTTYTSTDANFPWKIDFTRVETKANMPGAVVENEIELEFELLDRIKLQWLQETDVEKTKVMTKYIAERLLQLIEFCIPSEVDVTSPDSCLEAVDNIAAYGRLIQEVNALVVSNNPSSSSLSSNSSKIDFLGSMPVNLTRQSLMTVQNNDYYMAEKSDGVRYLLYVVRDPFDNVLTAVLLDRAKAVFKFKGSAEVGQSLGYGTVLDGELVFNLKFKEFAFLVFDTLLWAKESQLSKPFKDRLELIRNVVLRQYANNIGRFMAIPGKAKPINLIRKTFVHKEEGLHLLLDKIHTNAQGERIYFDTDRRNHKTDGIIFQPNGPYLTSRNQSLLKWKWSDLRSVDLAVSPVRLANSDKVELRLMCGGPDMTFINCSVRGDTNVALGQFDSYRLYADIEENIQPGGPPAVVEVAYDVNVGMWSYLHYRKDKKQPNYIDTVLGVFVEQAESIDVEELEYCLNASTFKGAPHLDFHEQLALHAKQLLAVQRDQIAAARK
mmetsp:Transcript_13537/g.20314  ORF Transcript_13537/g.20314 Transcript_13537/m.20314 type:complete len:704 (+) Transcript_13537:1725-3836(+)